MDVQQTLQEFFGLGRDDWEMVETCASRGSGDFVDKRLVYPVLALLASRAQHSIKIYSASACFGHFNAGMKCLEAFMQAVSSNYKSKAADPKRPEPITVSVIINIQDDLDLYAYDAMSRWAHELNRKYSGRDGRSSKCLLEIRYRFFWPGRDFPTVIVSFPDAAEAPVAAGAPAALGSQLVVTEHPRDDFQLFIVDELYMYSPHQAETFVPCIRRFINPIGKAQAQLAKDLAPNVRKMLDGLFADKWEAGSGEYEGNLFTRKLARIVLTYRKATVKQRWFVGTFAAALLVAVVLAILNHQSMLNFLGATGAIVSALALYLQLFSVDTDR